jgi:hypothetical protein
MPVAFGPDFICIGMQKAGTGWLFDQLQYHPDFWMPPVKEMHFLDREVPHFSNAKKKLRRADKLANRERRGLRFRRDWDERDLKFLNEMVAMSDKPLDLFTYGTLFRYKRDLLSGDVTPGYSGMAEGTIAEVGHEFPDLKVIFLVRDPVARFWSQISMVARQEKFDPALLDDPIKFREFLLGFDLVQKVGFPARIAGRWDRRAPKISFQHFFFDDLSADPAGTRARILAYLGADPDKESSGLEPERNRKAKADKLEMTGTIKEVIVDFFTDELRAAAARFGGHAAAWPPLYGV